MSASNAGARPPIALSEISANRIPRVIARRRRVYELADRFRLPLITFIDTQGAEPGVGAEERGQTEAIAHNLELMARLEVPSIACVIGEGGSGGALALGVANVVLIQENACYSVITPEGCAAILWREATEENVARAADALRLSAPDLLRLGVVDEIIAEPEGGAHTNRCRSDPAVGDAIRHHLKDADEAESGRDPQRTRAQVRRDGLGVPDLVDTDATLKTAPQSVSHSHAMPIESNTKDDCRLARQEPQRVDATPLFKEESKPAVEARFDRIASGADGSH